LYSKNSSAMSTESGIYYKKFAVGDEAWCVWDRDLPERKLRYLRTIDPGYFDYVAEANKEKLETEAPTQLHVLVVRSACRERAIPAERVGSEAVVVDYYVRTAPHDAPIRRRDQRCITNNCTVACGSPDSTIGYVAV
jgi:hypothetical protein